MGNVSLRPVHTSRETEGSHGLLAEPGVHPSKLTPFIVDVAWRASARALLGRAMLWLLSTVAIGVGVILALLIAVNLLI